MTSFGSSTFHKGHLRSLNNEHKLHVTLDPHNFKLYMNPNKNLSRLITQMGWSTKKLGHKKILTLSPELCYDLIIFSEIRR